MLIPRTRRLGWQDSAREKVARLIVTALEIKQLQRYPASSRIQQALNYIQLSSTVEAKLFLVWILSKDLTMEETLNHHS